MKDTGIAGYDGAGERDRSPKVRERNFPDHVADQRRTHGGFDRGRGGFLLLAFPRQNDPQAGAHRIRGEFLPSFHGPSFDLLACADSPEYERTGGMLPQQGGRPLPHIRRHYVPEGAPLGYPKIVRRPEREIARRIIERAPFARVAKTQRSLRKESDERPPVAGMERNKPGKALSSDAPQKREKLPLSRGLVPRQYAIDIRLFPEKRNILRVRQPCHMTSGVPLLERPAIRRNYQNIAERAVTQKENAFPFAVFRRGGIGPARTDHARNQEQKNK